MPGEFTAPEPGQPGAPRVLVIEPDSTSGTKLILLLQRQGFNARLVRDAKTAVRALRDRALLVDPALVIFDLVLELDEGAGLLVALRDLNPLPVTLVWSDWLERLQPEMLGPRPGGIVVVPKIGMPPDKLVGLVQWLLEDPVAAAVSAFAQAHRLTNRETAILAGAVRGLSGKALAASLCIAPETARVHVSNILGKTGCRSFPQTIALFWHQIVGRQLDAPPGEKTATTAGSDFPAILAKVRPSSRSGALVKSARSR